VLEPVFAWASSYLLLGERLGTRASLGALLIIAGVLLSELKGGASQPSAEVGNGRAAAMNGETSR